MRSTPPPNLGGELMKSTRTYSFAGVVLLIGGLIGAVTCTSCSKAQNAQAEVLSVPDAPTVAVAKAAVENISRGLVLTAEFKPFQEIDVMAKVAGYVKKINVDVGDRVKEGQLLALIEVPEMADDQTRAQSMLNRSQAERRAPETSCSGPSRRIGFLTFHTHGC